MKKVFFHISDLTEGYNNVKNDASCIQIGEEVEFTLMHNSRSGKYSAIKIKKLNSSASKANASNSGSQLTHSSSTGKELNEQTDAQAAAAAKRPDHLITKLKIGNVDDISGKRLVLIRQPSKPDGKSFSRKLFERLPGSMDEIQRPDTLVVTPTAPADRADDIESNGNEMVAAEPCTDQTSTRSRMNLLIANDQDN